MDNPIFQFVSTIDDFNKYLPVCNLVTGRYLCFETFACVFLLKVIQGIPNSIHKLCFYYELPAGTQRDKLTTTQIVNHNTTILLSEAERIVLERISRDFPWENI